jgi:hypothetical protein
VREESLNGRQSRWLIDGEGWQWLTSASGKIGEKGKETSSPWGFLAGGERGGGGGLAHRRWGASG